MIYIASAAIETLVLVESTETIVPLPNSSPKNCMVLTDNCKFSSGKGANVVAQLSGIAERCNSYPSCPRIVGVGRACCESFRLTRFEAKVSQYQGWHAKEWHDKPRNCERRILPRLFNIFHGRCLGEDWWRKFRKDRFHCSMSIY